MAAIIFTKLLQYVVDPVYKVSRVDDYCRGSYVITVLHNYSRVDVGGMSRLFRQLFHTPQDLNLFW